MQLSLRRPFPINPNPVQATGLTTLVVVNLSMMSFQPPTYLVSWLYKLRLIRNISVTLPKMGAAGVGVPLGPAFFLSVPPSPLYELVFLKQQRILDPGGLLRSRARAEVFRCENTPTAGSCWADIMVVIADARVVFGRQERHRNRGEKHGHRACEEGMADESGIRN